MQIIVLYSTPSCGKCMLTENMLEDKVEYLSIKDTQIVREKAEELGTLQMPILTVNGTPFFGIDAVKKAKEIVEGIDG